MRKWLWVASRRSETEEAGGTEHQNRPPVEFLHPGRFIRVDADILAISIHTVSGAVRQQLHNAIAIEGSSVEASIKMWIKMWMALLYGIAPLNPHSLESTCQSMECGAPRMERWCHRVQVNHE